MCDSGRVRFIPGNLSPEIERHLGKRISTAADQSHLCDWLLEQGSYLISSQAPIPIPPSTLAVGWLPPGFHRKPRSKLSVQSLWAYAPANCHTAAGAVPRVQQIRFDPKSRATFFGAANSTPKLNVTSLRQIWPHYGKRRYSLDEITASLVQCFFGICASQRIRACGPRGATRACERYQIGSDRYPHARTVSSIRAWRPASFAAGPPIDCASCVFGCRPRYCLDPRPASWPFMGEATQRTGAGELATGTRPPAACTGQKSHNS